MTEKGVPLVVPDRVKELYVTGLASIDRPDIANVRLSFFVRMPRGAEDRQSDIVRLRLVTPNASAIDTVRALANFYGVRLIETVPK